MTLPLMVGAAIAGPALGRILSTGDRNDARNSANAAVQELLKVGLPPDLSNPVAINHLKIVGLYTPQLEQAIDLGITQTEQIQEDPALKAQQLRQMSALENISKEGMTPAQKAAMLKQSMDIDAGIRQQVDSELQALQRSGQGFKGASIQSRLLGAQAAANRKSEYGLGMAGSLTDASRNALQQLGNIAGDVRAQDFGVAKDKSSAADLRSRFNVEAAQGRQTRNVGTQNFGQERNLSRAEKVADTNVEMDNRELYRQNQAKEDLWNNQMKQANMRSGAYGGLSKYQQGQAQDTMDMYSKMGSGAATAMAPGGGTTKPGGP